MKTGFRPSTLDDGLKPYNWLVNARHAWSALRWRRLRCVLCGDGTDAVALCDPCRADLPWRRRPWQRRLSPIESVAVCFDFAYPVQQLLHRAKYGPDLALTALLGRLAVDYFRSSAAAIDTAAMLFPVPLSRRRMLGRGFNQAVELALPIARELSLELDVVSVHKPRSTLTQATLDRTRRRVNARDAFRCRAPLAVECAIIVDDVVTTGATVQAMARTLRGAGARRVIVWALAAA